MEKNYAMSSPGRRSIYFGSIAVFRNYVTLGQVQRALAEQMEDAVMRKPHRLLGNILLEKKWITEEQMKSILVEMGVSNTVGECSWDRNLAATVSH
jgi:hypothetical protein